MKNKLILVAAIAAITASAYDKDQKPAMPPSYYSDGSIASNGDKRTIGSQSDAIIYNSQNQGKENAYTRMKVGFMQQWAGDYKDTKDLLIETIDQKDFTCRSKSSVEKIIKSRIGMIDKVIPEIDSQGRPDTVFANKLLNDSYIPFCTDMLNKSIGSLSFSKKYNSGIGRNFSNENYCLSFYNYLNHLEKQNDEAKYSYAAFVSRFSDYSLKNYYKGQDDLVVRASALLHYLNYGMAGFEPLGFAEIYNKNNNSTASKIGGKDPELELFLVSILSGNFKTADDILKDNIPATKEVFTMLDKAENCNFNKLPEEFVVDSHWTEISRSELTEAELQYAIPDGTNECVSFTESMSKVFGKEVSALYVVDFMKKTYKNLHITKKVIPVGSAVILDLNADSQILVFSNKASCEQYMDSGF